MDCESNCRLECSGIWGGIHNRNLDVKAGKVIASIYSSACDGGKSGYIYYFGICKDDTITRLVIADVLGHGESVTQVSQYVYYSLKTHMCNMGSRTILGSVNRLVSGRGLEAMTTAAVNHFCSPAVSDNMLHDDADHTWILPYYYFVSLFIIYPIIYHYLLRTALPRIVFMRISGNELPITCSFKR